MTKRFLLTIFCFSILLITGSAQNYSSAERGLAVYYADYLEGQPTAYGEVYRRDQLTAAHRTHPSGTLLKVTRLDTRRSVIVRVNDRGAYCDGCVVDLSKIAALQLDLLRTGTAMVQVEVIGKSGAQGANPQLAARSSYTRPTYSAPANQHSTYPRPDAGFGASSIYTTSSNYSQPDRPVSYSVSEQPVSYSTPNVQARSPQVYSAPQPQPQPQVQAKAPVARTSYDYYQAQSVQTAQRQATTSSDKATYERLRARGLLPEGESKDSDAAFYSRGGLAQPATQPRNYEQNPEPRINAKGAANPTAYIQWNNTPTSTAAPKAYSSTSSFPTTYNAEARVPNGQYAIQMASYRNFGNAQRQLSQVRRKGLVNAYLLETSNSGGKLYKVLNGPFQNKEAATKELRRYKQELLLDGIVILLR